MLLNHPIPGPLVTMVVPACNEATRLPRLYQQIQRALASAPCRWEVLLVDDGSEDGTARVWRELMAHDRRLGLIELCRNFGKEAALLAGLRHARGDVVVPMDADLQDPPEVIPRFLLHWRAGYDHVYGVRSGRDDPSWQRVSSWLFYRCLRACSRLEIAAHAGDFRLLDRRVVDRLCALPEVDRFTRGLYHWVGGPACAVAYHRPGRIGARRYRLAQSLDQAFAALSFCSSPMRSVLLAGLLLLLGGGVLALVLLVRHGSASFGALLWVQGLVGCGLPMSCCGMLGICLEGMAREVKQRPSYLIARVAGAVRADPHPAAVGPARHRRGADLRVGARGEARTPPGGEDPWTTAEVAPLALPPPPPGSRASTPPDRRPGPGRIRPAHRHPSGRSGALAPPA